MHNKDYSVCGRSELNLVRFAKHLNVATQLVCPVLARLEGQHQALMKQIRRTAYFSNLIARNGERAACCDDCNIWIAEPILTGAQFDLRRTLVAERQDEFLVEAVEPEVIIEQEAR